MPLVYMWRPKKDKYSGDEGLNLSRKVVIPDKTLHKLEDEEIIEDLRWLEATKGSADSENKNDTLRGPLAVGMPYEKDVAIDSDEEDDEFYKADDGNIYRPPIGIYLRPEEEPTLKSRGEITREIVMEGLLAIRSDTFVVDSDKSKISDSEDHRSDLASRLGVPDGQESSPLEALLAEYDKDVFEDKSGEQERRGSFSDLHSIVSTIKDNLKLLRETSSIDSSDIGKLRSGAAPEVAAILTGNVEADADHADVEDNLEESPRKPSKSPNPRRATLKPISVASKNKNSNRRRSLVPRKTSLASFLSRPDAPENTGTVNGPRRHSLGPQYFTGSLLVTPHNPEPRRRSLQPQSFRSNLQTPRSTIGTQTDETHPQTQLIPTSKIPVRVKRLADKWRERSRRRKVGST
jgi:hypothetical protein